MTLTPRQVEVLAAYVVAGSAKAAGERLGLSTSTIKVHLHNIRRITKLTTEQAVYFGAREGWLVLRELPRKPLAQ